MGKMGHSGTKTLSSGLVLTSKSFVCRGLGGGPDRTRICDLYRVKADRRLDQKTLD